MRDYQNLEDSECVQAVSTFEMSQQVSLVVYELRMYSMHSMPREGRMEQLVVAFHSMFQGSMPSAMNHVNTGSLEQWILTCLCIS